MLVFYEVFRFLEEHVPETILPREYYRTEAFEADLKFYKGEDWMKTYKPRPAVQKYLSHLKKIQEEDPSLLIAYVYHLYLGLLSGGQILQKKRKIAKKLKFSFSATNEDSQQYNENDNTVFNDENIEPGYHVTSIKNKPIAQLKINLKKIIDDFVKDFDEDTKQKLVEESRTVFQLNNEVIKTVEGVANQNLKLLMYVVIFILTLYLFVKLWHS